MPQSLTRRSAILQFALEYLAANLDDLRGDLEPPLDPLPKADEIYEIFRELRAKERPAEDVKVSHVLWNEFDSFNVCEGQSLQDILDAGGTLIDHCMEPPIAVFQTDDGRWLRASIECDISPVNEEFIRQELLERIEDVETCGDETSDDPKAELIFLRAELAKLPPAEEPAGDK